MPDRQDVPPYNGHSTSLHPEQREFLVEWMRHWKRGQVLGVGDQLAYISYYIEHETRHQPVDTMDSELIRILKVYGTAFGWPLRQCVLDCYLASGRYEDALAILRSQYYQEYEVSIAIADCYILLARYQDALKVIEDVPFYPRDYIWDLKLVTGDRIKGREIIHVSTLTDFGKRNLNEVTRILDELLANYEQEHNVNLIRLWAEESDTFFFHKVMHGWTHRRSTKSRLRHYEFSHCASIHLFSKKITRIAENAFRKELGIPNVGEKWISETELYYQIRYALSEFKVLRHHSPYWLGRQHLDIYIPELKLALEYQGMQHDEPVEFFGGEVAFERRKKLDARKKMLCEKYGVYLIYVRSGYALTDVLCNISQHSSADVKITFPAYPQIATNWRTQLAQLDPKEVPEQARFEYKLAPELQLDPISFNLNHPVPADVVERFYELGRKIVEYSNEARFNPREANLVIELCKEQIALGFDMAQHFYREGLRRRRETLMRAKCAKDEDSRRFFERYAERCSFSGPQTGYFYLIEIYEKQRNYKDALKYAVKAKSECWPEETTKWDKVIVRLLAKLEMA